MPIFSNKFKILSFLFVLIVQVLIIFNFLIFYPKNSTEFDLVTNLDLMIDNLKTPVEINKISNYIDISKNFDKDLVSLQNYTKSAKFSDSAYFQKASVFLDQEFQTSEIINEKTALKLNYKTETSKLEFFYPASKVLLGNKAYKPKDILVLEIEDIKIDDILKIGDNNLKVQYVIKSEGILYNFDFFKDEIKVFRRSGENLLKNYQNPNLQNCSQNSDSSNNVSYLETEQKEIQLTSKNNQNACLNISTKVSNNTKNLYDFSFEYKNLEGLNVGFYYNFFDNENWQTGSTNFRVFNQEWNDFSLIANQNSENVISSSLIFYSPSVNNQVNTNLFRNLSLYEYAEYKKTNINLNNFLVKDSFDLDLVVNPKDVASLQTKKNALLGNNLIPQELNSFENYTWQEEIKGCNFNGSRNFSGYQKLIENATNGQKSQLIAAEKSRTCITTTFPLDIDYNKQQSFSFDYLNLNGSSSLEYYINFHDGLKWDVFNGVLPPSTDWKNFSRILTPTLKNPKTATIIFYINSPEGLSEGAFDNLKLEPIDNNSKNVYYLDKNPNLLNHKSEILLNKSSQFDNYLEIKTNNQNILLEDKSGYNRFKKVVLTTESSNNLLTQYWLYLTGKSFNSDKHFNYNNGTNLWLLENVEKSENLKIYYFNESFMFLSILLGSFIAFDILLVIVFALPLRSKIKEVYR
jgi:hypothetical protein